MSRLIWDIRDIGIMEYERVVSEFVREFNARGVALYRFGRVKHPGISDLDLALVFDEEIVDAERLRCLVRRVRWFQEKTNLHRYLFTHDILVYPKQVFRKIMYLHSMQELTHLAGEPFSLDNVNKQDLDVVTRVHFLNFNWNALAWLAELKRSKFMSARNLLLALGSVQHGLSSALNYLSTEGSLCDEISDWIEKIERLRSARGSLPEICLDGLYQILERILQVCASMWIVEWIACNNYQGYLDRVIWVLRGRVPFRCSLALALHGAAYGNAVEGEISGYERVHRLLYPLGRLEFIDEIYLRVIQKQIRLLRYFERFEKEFSIKPLVPMFCWYCSAVLSKRKYLGLVANWLLVKAQLYHIHLRRKKG